MANPNVGLLYPVWAKLTSHTDGSMPTYGTGRVIQEARNVSITYEYPNNPLYGDDRIVDDDNGLSGLTISFESTGLSDQDRIEVLGEEAWGTTAQWVSDNASDWGGFGYIRRMRDNGTRKFEAWITLKIKFAEESQSTATKEGSITWGTPTLNGRAAALYVDNTGKGRFQLHKTFSSIDDAKSFINTMLNVPDPTTT